MNKNRLLELAGVTENHHWFDPEVEETYHALTYAMDKLNRAKRSGNHREFVEEVDNIEEIARRLSGVVTRLDDEGNWMRGGMEDME